ncbi:MAG: fumarylacetoacetate hydrolase family protein [Oleiphilaceae bacterium]|nr:fumarylacetoacetate hydrolase family protein [Oleiphilaceae bacterium]
MFQGKIVCVGRNYAEHAKELNNPVPETPLLFIKPSTALADVEPEFRIPASDCHYEAELAVRIGRDLQAVTPDEAVSAIDGYALALDLTKRECQSALKAKGHPWEIAKAFDGSCPITPFVSPDALNDPAALKFSLSINGSLRQQGDTADMLTPIPQLLSYITQHFTLRAGDIVLTGTPAGVGQLSNGDVIKLELQGAFSWSGVAKVSEV